MQNNKPKVVFTFVEAGFGHIMPAKAICDAFENKYGKECEVVRWNIFSDSSDPVIQKYCRAIYGWTKETSQSKLLYAVEGLSYKIPSKLTLKFLDIKFRKAKKKIMQSIVDVAPALMVSTYYSPSHFASECNKYNLTDTLVATYTPDPVIYPAWDRRANLFFVNNQSQYKRAIRTGFNESSLRLIPCVLRKEISQTSPDKVTAKINLGLDKGKKTVIYALGAYGTKKDKKHLKTLLLANLDANIVVICGKNQSVYDYCKKLVEEKNLKNVYVVGFVQNIFEYLRAGDVFLGKSGSNSLLEARYFKLPILVTACASPLETLTAKYYINNVGGCKKVLSSRKMIKAVKNIFANPSTCESKVEANQLCDLTSAEKIADELYFALKRKLENVQGCKGENCGK